jgi:hypothetical protein
MHAMFAKSHAVLKLTECKRPWVLNSILSSSIHDVPDIPNLPVPAFNELHIDIGPTPRMTQYLTGRLWVLEIIIVTIPVIRITGIVTIIISNIMQVTSSIKN